MLRSAGDRTLEPRVDVDGPLRQRAHNAISNVNAKLRMLKNVVTAEGHPTRRFDELRLLKNESPAFALSLAGVASTSSTPRWTRLRIDYGRFHDTFEDVRYRLAAPEFGPLAFRRIAEVTTFTVSEAAPVLHCHSALGGSSEKPAAHRD